MSINWARLKPAKVKEGQQIANPVLDDFEEKCRGKWKTQSAETAKAVEAGSQDDSGLGGQGLQTVYNCVYSVTGATSESATCIATGPSLAQV